MLKLGFGELFIFIPVTVHLLSGKISKNISNYPSSIFSSLTVYIIWWVFGVCETNQVYINNNNMLVISLSFFAIIVAELIENVKKDECENETKNKENPKMGLFNIFYINTSKMHEIVMLIDNKIINTIENEKTRGSTMTRSNSLGIDKSGVAGEVSTSEQISLSSTVYENFDVKTTKSILLQTLYQKIKEKDIMLEPSNVGDVVLIKETNLQPNNLDDTVFLLNALKGSKFKQKPSDDVEFNMEKLLDDLLEGLNIDYLFDIPTSDDKKKKCLLQLPYKTKEGFENGYNSNDLQLGKLSVIAIYRGEIDFTGRESINFKIRKLITDSIENPAISSPTAATIMNHSTKHQKEKNTQFPFEVQTNKLVGKHHLFDVVAIIQEIKI